MKKYIGAVCLTWILSVPAIAHAETPEGKPLTYEKDVAPILRKYCAGCHNDGDREGEFSLESYQSMLKGTDNGPAFLAKNPESSRLFRLMTGTTDPKMPPEDEPAPSKEEIESIRLWIEQGAKGPEGAEPDRLALHVPQIQSKTDRRPITAIALSPDGNAMASARYGEVVISRKMSGKDKEKQDWQTTATLKEFRGKVTSVHFCLDGKNLITSSGVVGLGGVATLWEMASLKKVREFAGHRDIMFDAEASPDGKLLATCSYDQSITIWDLNTGKRLRVLDGHNGAVYDVAFSPDSKTLLSASADATCKVWRVSDGMRLDTLGQPLKEQYCVSFSPDGKLIAAGGADNRIRIWKYISKTRPQINPILYSRFAHEGPIVNLAFTGDGQHLVSIAEDKTMKVWETKSYTETQLLANQREVAMALAVSPSGKRFVVGRLDGSLESFEIKPQQAKTGTNAESVVISPKSVEAKASTEFSEEEPNQTPDTAQSITIPAVVKGIAFADGDIVDADCYKFSAKAGEEWVFEINAARSKSNLDSLVEIFTSDGKPIERLLLQAVRDSYFTFRGKTADQTTDFRVFNWKEMELNEYLYANGEVVKLWLYPRGPDSGFNVYPGTGKRWGYFDTTSLAHALGEPCYIVNPHPPGTELIPNGLPVFKLYYQNDDESQRKLGKDSKLFFTTPADGDYVVRVRDVRGMDGKDFTYILTARARRQDFSVNLLDKSLTISAGGAKEIRFTADRQDNFEGPIEINIAGLPAGYKASSPITVESGQTTARGIISATSEAQPLDKEALKNVKITASARTGEDSQKHTVVGFDEFKIDEKPKLQIAIVPAKSGVQPLTLNADGPLEFIIHPGETIMLQVDAERLDFKGEVPFGKEEAGRNLPHGIFIDNIGLNGLLLLNEQTQREFFITAAKWVPEQSRLFHLTTPASGGHATQSVLLHVRSRPQASETGAE